MKLEQAKFTPGPWRIHHKHRRFRRLILAGPDTPRDGIVVAEILDGDIRLPQEVAQANAVLIASATELFDALKAIVTIAGRSTPEFDTARALIRKCEG